MLVKFIAVGSADFCSEIKVSICIVTLACKTKLVNKGFSRTLCVSIGNHMISSAIWNK